jgi:paraquat-inducible protein A
MTPTAKTRGLVSCHECAHVAALPAETCPRCGAHLHQRKRASIERTWALLIAAILLYPAANLLPVMITSSLVGSQADTIMSGVIYLWKEGSPMLALVVLVASIVVPLLKIGILLLLLVTAQRASLWRPAQRARLYRMVEAIGRWSMLDVFVVALLAALVHIKSLATITAGPGTAAFGAVVVLTMLASHSFDPRLIWDPQDTAPTDTTHDDPTRPQPADA